MAALCGCFRVPIMKYWTRTVHTRLISQRGPAVADVDKGGSEDKEPVICPERPEREMKFTCGKYAGLADGCAVAEFGGTAVMSAVVGKGNPVDLDIPLHVSYHQKAAAMGRIPTNFLRRDLGQTDNEILISRVIDRSLRPLFKPGEAIETQILCSPLALDGVNFPEVVAINAASAALSCSGIPWNGPVAASRVVMNESGIIINPTKLEAADSVLNLIIAVTKKNNVVMMEGFCNNVSMNDIQKCVKLAVKSCKTILNNMEQSIQNHKKDTRIITNFYPPQELIETISMLCRLQLDTILSNHSLTKLERDNALSELYEICAKRLVEQFPHLTDIYFRSAFKLVLQESYTNLLQGTGIRCDGRNVNDLRVITCETGMYSSLHGCSVFKRGQTQVFSTVTLDSPNAGLRMDNVSMYTTGIKEKNFFVHYEFPPYAVGETSPSKKRNRREVGHGNLAERALKSAVPSLFPFTIRLSAEVLESNGSSSMATVCGGTLALLDAGVPLEFRVAGVAMGLFPAAADKSIDDSIILTDISGFEDYLGQIDLKIAGTKSGITAVQLDMKVPGIPVSLIYAAFNRARKAINSVLECMETAIPKNRVDRKENWPVMQVITIPPHARQYVIGLGGSNIRKLELEIGMELIEIDNNKFSIFAVNQEAMNEALQKIQDIIDSRKEVELEFGGIYTATVVEIKDTGCLVTLYPSMTPAFIPVSQLGSRRVNHPSALGLEVGSQFQVKFFGRDPVSGNMRLSKKILECQPDS